METLVSEEQGTGTDQRTEQLLQKEKGMKCCMNCGYQVHSEGEYVCCNEESDYYGDFVESLHRCPDWASEDEWEEGTEE